MSFKATTAGASHEPTLHCSDCNHWRLYVLRPPLRTHVFAAGDLAFVSGSAISDPAAVPLLQQAFRALREWTVVLFGRWQTD